jgi:hypothetical protein
MSRRPAFWVCQPGHFGVGSRMSAYHIAAWVSTCASRGLISIRSWRSGLSLFHRVVAGPGDGRDRCAESCAVGVPLNVCNQIRVSVHAGD